MKTKFSVRASLHDTRTLFELVFIQSGFDHPSKEIVSKPISKKKAHYEYGLNSVPAHVTILFIGLRQKFISFQVIFMHL